MGKWARGRGVVGSEASSQHSEHVAQLTFVASVGTSTNMSTYMMSARSRSYAMIDRAVYIIVYIS